MEKELKKLVSQLNLTKPDSEQEEYILTFDEEKKLLENEIISLKKHKAWKMFTYGLSQEEIEIRLSEIDFEKEINKDDLFRRANSTKLYDIWIKEKRQKEYEFEVNKKIELQKRCDARYMFNVMAWTSKNKYNRKLIVNDDNKFFITALCYFLSNDTRFETELGKEYSLKKGLLIRGISGLGKTYLLGCVKDNDLKPIELFSMIDIAETVKEDGECNLETDKLIYLDDVGTEENIVNYYGTKINFFKNFIERFYLMNTVFNRLIISTNNNFSELENKYGFRVRSRMKDMFNVIDVTGQDMRGL